jgi:hypothetical protein
VHVSINEDVNFSIDGKQLAVSFFYLRERERESNTPVVATTLGGARGIVLVLKRYIFLRRVDRVRTVPGLQLNIKWAVPGAARGSSFCRVLARKIATKPG